MYVTYGLKVTSPDEPLVGKLERAVEIVKAAVFPGAYLVNTFPMRTFSTINTSSPQ